MEVEIKAKIEDSEEFEEKIKKMGATFVKEITEEDCYYNHPCRNFADTDEALRIRNDFTLTYKGPKVDSDTKSREEYYIKFDSMEKMEQILEKLGFTKVAEVKKRRKYYKLGELNITIDFVENLGKFTEIECIGEYGPCREKVMLLVKELNLKNLERKSYLELVLSHRGTA